MTYLLHRDGRRIVNWQNARHEREHKNPRTFSHLLKNMTGWKSPSDYNPKQSHFETSFAVHRAERLPFGRTNYSKIPTLYSVLTPSTMLLRQPVPFGSSRAATAC